MGLDPAGVTLLVTGVFESLRVPYFIGGSLAAAVHGVARSTIDSDLVARLRPEHAEPLYLALHEEFYVDPDSISRAIDERGHFNAIHLDTMFKVDVFVSKDRPYDDVQFERRTRVLMAEPHRTADVATAEDTILSKLEWYRRGGGVSERQWRDVVEVLRVQEGRLDVAYLKRWADALGLEDLLARSLRAATCLGP
jgi:hypothetical protein